MNATQNKPMLAGGVAVIFVIAAWLGVISAHQWVIVDHETGSQAHPIGSELTLNTPSNEVIGGIDAKRYRDFLFSQQNDLSVAEFWREGEVMKLPSSIKVKVLKYDLDLLQMEVIEGRHAGAVVWIEEKVVGKVIPK